MPRVRVEISKIRCDKPTDRGPFQGRDEVYWFVTGGAPNGSLYRRAPREGLWSHGYFGFEEGHQLTRQTLVDAIEMFREVPDAARMYRTWAQEMVLWEGWVGNRDLLLLNVAFMEQDNDTFGWLVNLFKQIEASAVGDILSDHQLFRNLPGDIEEAGELIRETEKRVRQTVGVLSRVTQGTDHDPLGGFTVSVTAPEGVVEAKWTQLEFTNIDNSSNQRATFSMHNPTHDSRYVVEAAIHAL